MGKRSNFERNPRDYYPTPPEAVTPLIPYLVEGLSYWEPCAGDGALVRSMPAWTYCKAASDTEPQAPWIDRRNAFAVHNVTADCIITNPPWRRDILHPMIEHFASMRPTWLLFDADWMHTKQSAQFMPFLRKIVSVGRVKWIPGSKMTGKDNCVWYLFDKDGDEPCRFYGRQEG